MNFIYHVCVELIFAGMVVSVGVCVCVHAIFFLVILINYKGGDGIAMSIATAVYV